MGERLTLLTLLRLLLGCHDRDREKHAVTLEKLQREDFSQVLRECVGCSLVGVKLLDQSLNRFLPS